ncbi:MAG: 1-acyl-sn-glycerol-3-phosphate acyltransferase [Prevotellaceae bacterium]|nr:1-acyl-sn-glycerol-3-phosphate acyltransferase [Prevotellaceae bacterium]
MKQTFYTIYLWLFGIWVASFLTLLAAILTMLTSPLAPNSRWAHSIPQIWAKLAAFFLMIRVKVYGKENVVTTQSYVYVSNHQSMVDIFVIYGWLPSVFKWIMKADLGKIPFVGWACKAAGHIFLNRSTAVEAIKSMEEAKQKLQNGVSVLVFPEGSRTKTGAMGRFKKGAFRISEDLLLPIVPITLKGSYDRLPRNHGPRFACGTVEMFIHQPITLENFRPEDENELMQKVWDIINSKL